METYQLSDLLDISIIQKMADAHYRATGMPIGIIDAFDSSVLVGAGWQDICVKFHRKNPVSLKRCHESDNFIKKSLVEGDACHYKCKNGLWDIGIPIIVADQHLATMFLGQFFYEEETKNRDFFINQARELGFDEAKYLDALDRTPLLSKEKVHYILEYDKALARFIADLAENALMRLKSEENLKISEQRYALAQRTGNIGSWDWDITSGTLHWSDQIEPMFGFEPGSFKGTYEAFMECVYPDDREKVSKSVEHCINDHADYNIEHRIIWPDGTVRWLCETGNVLRNDQGKPVRMLGIVQDITARKLAEERTEKLLKDMEQRNAEMERFVYTVSHDLKTPLITIEGFVDFLHHDLMKNNLKRVDDCIRRITSATRKMRQLLDELVELSKTGRIVGEMQKIDFKLFIEESMQFFDERFHEKNIKLILDTDFPPLYGDRKRLLEVMINLIDNAVKYMGDTPDPWVRIGSYKNGSDYVYYVQDNGIGINPRYIDKIFMLFEKLDPQTEGSGIGLALVKRIITVHGGRIWVESEGDGKGTTFYFTVPRPKRLAFTDNLQKQTQNS